MKKIISFLWIISLPLISSANETQMSLDDLLQEIKSEHHRQSAENRQREQEFMNKKSQQKSLLNKAHLKLKKQEEITARLTKQFENNEKVLTKIEDKLNMALGTLGELFGVVRQVSGDLKGVFQTSIISSEIPQREEWMGRLAETKALPEIKDLESLWFEMQREMTESGKVSQFKKSIVLPSGQQEEKVITRVGSFNLVADGAYLLHQHETGQIIELPRQPSGRFTSLIKGLENGDHPYNPFAIDPSRGSILSMLVQAPNFLERIQQGGIVGYVIIFLLFVGLVIVWERIIYLKKEDERIKYQLESSSPNPDNALGRLLKTFNDNKTADIETLELKMDEAILQNAPPIERGIGSVKILATVAPLLGLLGTVTGMIATFQSITLFGTGDPKLMAGGISQALITTVLGLICAIPLLLLHNVISTKSRRIIQLLEKQTIGLMAERMDQKNV